MFGVAADAAAGARRLRYLYPPRRLRLAGALKQLASDREPMLLQVGRQIADGHSLGARRPLLRFTCANAFFRFSRSRTASIDGPATAGCSRQAFAVRALRTLGRRRFGLHPPPGAQVQLDLIVLPHGSHEILLVSSTVRAFGGALPPTMPSADFCAAVRPPCNGLKSRCRDTAQTSRGKTDRLHRTPAGFITPDL
jgi:hypothetical protein